MNTSTPASISKNSREPGFLGKRPWLFVVGAFVLLFAAWTTMFMLAYKNLPESIPLVNEQK